MAHDDPLHGARIVLGVCGSIASYKAADLASKLTQAGAEVDVILTGAAQKFVAPLTFRGLTGRPVFTDMYDPQSPLAEEHVALVNPGLPDARKLKVVVARQFEYDSLFRDA